MPRPSVTGRGAVVGLLACSTLAAALVLDPRRSPSRLPRASMTMNAEDARMMMMMMMMMMRGTASEGPTRRAALVGAATGALLAPRTASATERYLEQTIVDVRPDGTTASQTVRVFSGEKTGLDLSRRLELDLFTDEEVASWPPQAPFSPGDFRRLDEGDDASFYPADEPKYVYHIDEGAVAALTNYYAQRIPPQSAILDICSSWVSHYPRTFPTTMATIVGTGINERELKANAQLAEYVVRDLNKQPSLPFPDNSFDVVTCVVSVDYLTQPIKVLADIHRVLKPGGVVIFSQSNRLFFTKAVRMWLSMGDEDHLELIGKYLKYAGFTNRPRALDITAKGHGARDPMFICECVREA